MAVSAGCAATGTGSVSSTAAAAAPATLDKNDITTPLLTNATQNTTDRKTKGPRGEPLGP
jgi:hypothetical protein